MISSDHPKIAQEHFNTLTSMTNQPQGSIECKDKLSDFPNAHALPGYDSLINCKCILTQAVCQQNDNKAQITDLYFVKYDNKILLLTPNWKQTLRTFSTFQQANNQDSFPIIDNMTYFGCNGEGLFFLAYWPKALNQGKLFRNDQPDIFEQCFNQIKNNQITTNNQSFAEIPPAVPQIQITVPQASDTITVIVRPDDDKLAHLQFDIIQIPISRSKIGRDLKQEIKAELQKRQSIALSDNEALYFYNNSPIPDEKKLSELNMKNNANVFVVQKKRHKKYNKLLIMPITAHKLPQRSTYLSNIKANNTTSRSSPIKR